MKKTGRKLYKLKVLSKFYDIKVNENRYIGQEFDVTEKRALEIIKFNPSLVKVTQITKT